MALWTSRSHNQQEMLSRLRSELVTAGYTSIELEIIERELILEGWVQSYALKRRVEDLIGSFLDIPLRNHLKVTPGA